MAANKEFQKEASAVLDAHGIRGYRFEHKGSKHPKLLFEHGGKPHRFPYPGSPSDRRALLNQMASLKQYLRRMNVQPTVH